jgi:MFS family permease
VSAAGPGASRDFRRLWVGSTATSLADGIRLVSFPLLAASLTRDPLWIAVVSVAAYAPALLFGTLAGVLIDRLSKRNLIVAAHAARGLLLTVLAILVWRHDTSVPLLIVIAFLSGIGEAVAVPASASLVPDTVPADRLGAANSRLQSGQTAAEDFVGRAVGGVLFAAAQAVPFLVTALLLFAAAGVMAAISRTAAGHGPWRPRELVDEWREGFVIVARSRLLRSITVLVGAWNLSYGAYSAIAVVFALDVLRTDDAGFGLLLAVAAVGSFAGSLLAIPLIARVGAAPVAIGATLLSGTSMIALSLSRDPWSAGALLASDAFAIMVWNILSATLRQQVTPPESLGRVTAITRVLASVALPTAAALAGVLARAVGVTWVLVAAGAIVFLGAALVLPRLRPTLRELWPAGRRSPISG